MTSKKIILTAHPADPTFSRGCDLVFVNIDQAFVKEVSRRYDSFVSLKKKHEDLNTIFFVDTSCSYFSWDKRIVTSKTKEGECLKDALQGGIIEMPGSFKLSERLVSVVTESVMALSEKGVYFIATVDNHELVYSRMIPKEMFDGWRAENENTRSQRANKDKL